MNDEVRQIREETFNYILLSGVILSLILSIALLVAGGPTSPWFIRAVALFLVIGIAWATRLLGKFVTATYVLVIELVGLVAETFLHAGAITGFIPYLLIPVMLIAGFFFTPVATLAVTGLSILTLVFIAALAHQFVFTDLTILGPPFVLTIITALVGLKLKQGMTLLGDRLLESRTNLKARTLEIITVQRKVEELEQKTAKLEQRLQRARFDILQAQQQRLDIHDQTHQLIGGVTRELSSSLKRLEEAIIQVEEQPGVEGFEETLETIWQRVDHLRGLTINLEKMAQVEHSQIDLNYDIVDIACLLDEVVGIARGLAREKNLEVCRAPSEDLPFLQADPVRLRHVLLHVLGNAIKYTDRGTVEVQAQADEQELTILISDTGVGMKQEEVELVFEKFGRSSSQPAYALQGAGLGLAIDKRLIDLHGGRMGLSSVPGVGSTVYLILPLVPPKDRPTLQDDTPPPRTGRANSPVESDATQFSRSFPAIAPLPDNLAEVPVFHRTGVISSEPVRRFESLYIRRFTILGLGLLAGLACLVVILAAINGPTEQPALALSEPSVTTEAPPTLAVLVATIVPVSPTPLPSSTPSPTAFPSPTATQTATSQPQAARPTLAPSSTPEPAPSPTPTLTPNPLVSQPVEVEGAQLSFSTGQNDPLQANGFTLNGTAPDLKVVDDNSRLGWSPDGQQLLFTGDEQGDREIYLVDRASGRPVQLTAAAGDDLQADWSPDGRKIAFSSGRTGNFEIYVMDADGGNLVQLTASPGFDEWPAWSPDGSQIAFVSDREGNVELYVMQADGSGLKRLTNHPANDWPASWSPDGRRLVFASDREGNWNLYIVGVGGGPVLPLTNAPGNERDPIWSPDGQTIAFAHDAAGNWDIHVLSAPGETITLASQASWRQITATHTDERYPTWRP